MKSEYFAKTVFLSSLSTLFILVSFFYIYRYELLDNLKPYLTSDIETKFQKTVSDQELSIVEIIEEVNPAVVSLIATKKFPVYEQYYERFDYGRGYGSFNIPRVRENGYEEREVSSGSGFIVSNDGMVVTNRHVVEDKEATYSIVLNNGVAYKVDILAIDKQLDIAILKISEPLQSALSYLDFGDSESLRLGEPVIAIGNALGEFRNSVSVGVISGLSRSIVASNNSGYSEHLDQVIQTDAAINPGNSGGPLLNTRGEVIGVNVAVSRGADNIGFALPAHIVKVVTESVKEHGEIIRPYLGVRYTMVDSLLVKSNELPVDYGALIVKGEAKEDLAVMDGSPAKQAGLADGTIIMAIDEVELRNVDLATILRSKKVGQKISLQIWQDGEVKVVELILDKAL